MLSLALILVATLITILWLYYKSRGSRELRLILHQARSSFNSLLARDEYICRSLYEDWREEYRAIPHSSSLGAKCYWLFSPDGRTLRNIYRNSQQILKDRNSGFVDAELAKYKNWLDKVEKNPLTDRQRESILHDENNALVVAGAGTGKTSTVVAKAGYVLEKRLATSKEVLLLAFSRKAKDEMQERIKKRLSVDLETRTFHSLGLEIIAQSTGKKPSLSRLAEDKRRFRKVIQGFLDLMSTSKEFGEAMIEFFAFYLRPYRAEKEFKTLNEYAQYLAANDIRTLRGEKVKSYEELMIANWLFLHGIEYIYEKDYEVGTATIQHRQYQPDFYLPGAKIYIEHFGVDRKGRTAPFVSAREYKKGMKWKRALHLEHGTPLIETYSYEKSEGTLLSNLADNLSKHDVETKKISREQASMVFEKNVSVFAQLMMTFLRLFKSNQYTLEELRKKAGEESDSKRALAFCDLFEEVNSRYEKVLSDSKRIDFEDMIQKAIEHVVSGEYVPAFKYFIVDEFQDISRGRAMLLKSLLDVNKHRRLFCVGDDWQSIYRFTGSDVAIMTSFEDVFGFKKETHLNKTFRFDEALLKFSSKFILNNKKQISKSMESASGKDGDSIEVAWQRITEKDGTSRSLTELLAGINAVSAGEAASVLLLGRYNFNKPENLKNLQSHFSALKIQFMTIHAAKGLEADYVIVLDMSSGKHGFPCEMADDPLLNLVLPEPESFPNAEERRLFYVAVTRARKRAYLMASEFNRSVFVSEVESSEYDGLVELGESEFESWPCPTCRGSLGVRVGKYGLFWSCTNFPVCEEYINTCKACGKGGLIRSRNTAQCNLKSCAKKYRQCPRCSAGYLIKKSGKNGKFWGCSMWRKSGPSCGYTKNI